MDMESHETHAQKAQVCHLRYTIKDTSTQVHSQRTDTVKGEDAHSAISHHKKQEESTDRFILSVVLSASIHRARVWGWEEGDTGKVRKRAREKNTLTQSWRAHDTPTQRCKGRIHRRFRISESAANGSARQMNSPRATTPHKEQDGEIGGRVSLTLVSETVECL